MSLKVKDINKCANSKRSNDLSLYQLHQTNTAAKLSIIFTETAELPFLIPHTLITLYDNKRAFSKTVLYGGQ